MKNIKIYFLLLAISAAAFSQQTTNNVPPVKIDYLEKSKKMQRGFFVGFIYSLNNEHQSKL